MSIRYSLGLFIEELFISWDSSIIKSNVTASHSECYGLYRRHWMVVWHLLGMCLLGEVKAVDTAIPDTLWQCVAVQTPSHATWNYIAIHKPFCVNQVECCYNSYFYVCMIQVPLGVFFPSNHFYLKLENKRASVCLLWQNINFRLSVWGYATLCFSLSFSKRLPNL